MRTTARLLTGTALTVVAIGALGAPAALANNVQPLEINPASATPGTTVTVNTLACGPNGHGIGDARSVGDGEFQLNPSTHKEVVVGQFTVPQHAQPGTYGISVACDNGKTASGDLVIRHHGGQPSGHVQTGVGGSIGPDTAQVATGVAVLAAAVVGGTWLLRRRASGAQDS
ncbi:MULTISPECIES: hypothetical protein [Streptomyces]|uniref:Integral membrane protein n=1 Tax=Streptomyces solicathayae TaxID=3081768 RepID=A0ABZ0LYA7_9ACTN|nr:hypothetical protein [Streptomyces sp. HUAS YS2]WOX24504.1 hypothetical protein R2D22_25220 [Streptomyces sp. HUAS YS2]